MGDLGTGTCGHVVKMLHVESGRVMAVKQMRKSGVPEENNRIYMDLDVVLKCMECPYIVRCYGYFVTDSDVSSCPGIRFNNLRNRSRFEPSMHSGKSHVNDSERDFRFGYAWS